MESTEPTLLGQRRWAVRLGTAVGLAILLLGGLLGVLAGVSPALADPNTFYVDGAGGSDTGSCGTNTAPCKTISHTLNARASEGDIIRVAQGTYTENLTVNISVTIEGGYEAAGWTRDLTAYETILDGSGAGVVQLPWDAKRVRYPMVLFDSGTYKMWYNGYDLFGGIRVGYATSPDGLTWTKYSGNPVLDVGAPGAWDSQALEAPFVIKEGPTSYKMWYSGQGEGSCGIGYATSSDGVNWTKHLGNPILSPGADDWNNVCPMHPFVIYEGGMYKMWLLSIGNNGSGDAPYVAYATSPDGLAWTWHTNFLFDRDWEEWLWRPDVLHQDSTYHMWYSLQSSGEIHTGYATSSDGLAWSRRGSPVLSGTDSEWDDNFAADPFVRFDGSTYTMWYDNESAIGVVTSTNGITWTKFLTSPVLTPSIPSQWGQPVVNVDNSGINVVLDGLTILGGAGNEAGGVRAIEADVTIRNCLIRDNLANGSPNYWGAGGVMGGGSALLTIMDSRIVDNQVIQGAGGVRVGEGTLVLSNTLVADNHGDPGLHLNGAGTLLNATIANNDGGIVYNPPFAAMLVITNSIIYPNQWAIGSPGAGTVQASYSDIEGGWSGTGNLDVDPAFVDPDHGDYRLSSGSPCVDVGTDIGAPDHDLDQTPRPLDGDNNGVATTDMGAYELEITKVYLPLLFKMYPQ